MKFRQNARMRDGPVIAKPGPTRRKIVVPIVGPRPIIVISRRPRSRRNLTSTPRPSAMRSRQKGGALLSLGRRADVVQIHEGIVELRDVPEHADGPFRSPADRRSEEHTSELQSRLHLVCRLLL